MLEIVFYSAIIGIFAGGCLAAGASRMYHIPNIQSMGSFRGLGELNACQGDPISHFSFGLAFFFSCAASAVGTGALTQDVMHRIIPNWSAALVLFKNKNRESIQNPGKMMIAGAIVGPITYVLINTLSSFVPAKLSSVASEVLIPAADWLINPVMPIIFFLAAIDGGKFTTMWGIILGGMYGLISGNCLPGIVLGIIVGKAVEENGYKSRFVQIMIAIIIVLTISIAYFRGVFAKF